MNKKMIKIGVISGFILITGICYSFTFVGCSKTALSTSLTNEDKEDKNSNNMETKDMEDKITPKVTEGATVTDAAEQGDPVSYVYVHICGSVKKPGVYQAKAGSRICDLILLAGGLKKNAAGDYLNQAELVTDGQRIYIPTLDEVESITPDEYAMEKQSPSSQAEEKKTGLININTAAAEELMTLPGIGQSKADSIIDYRTQNGEFKSIEDLMKITGIKEGVFKRISSYITVN